MGVGKLATWVETKAATVPCKFGVGDGSGGGAVHPVTTARIVPANKAMEAVLGQRLALLKTICDTS